MKNFKKGKSVTFTKKNLRYFSYYIQKIKLFHIFLFILFAQSNPANLIISFADPPI